MKVFQKLLVFILFLTHDFTMSKRNVSSLLRSRTTFPLIHHKTKNQGLYKNLLCNEKNRILLVTGPAGSGKTKMACDYAINQLLAKNVTKIILTRPVVSVERENLGFLPGSIGQKMDPWTRPLFDIFQEYLSMKEIHSLVESGNIEISPLGFMRGRTFQNSIVIADEMQNSTPNQMLMLLTRIGKGTKMIITGDAQQSDLGVESNGLTDFSIKLKSQSFTESIGMVEMNDEDIVREAVVKEVLELYTSKTSVENNTTSSKEEKRSSSGLLEDCAIIPLHLYKAI
jgi:phosphate starvation-inducible protein PhoH and related proteins